MSNLDPGTILIEHINKTCGHNDEVRDLNGRGYTWWGHRLAQHVWADEGFEDDDHEIHPLHATIDLIHGVEPSLRLHEILAEFNANTTMSSLCYDPERKQVFSHTSMNCHEGTVEPAKLLFTTAVALQNSEAHDYIDDLNERVGGEISLSGHPDYGAPGSPDEILGITGLYRLYGHGDPPELHTEMEQLEDIASRISVLSNGGKYGITAEFPFSERIEHPLIPGKPMTSMLRIKSDWQHPTLGSGIYIRLDLPIHDPDPTIASQFNLESAVDWHREPALGAWSADERTIFHQTFIPKMTYRPGMAINFFMYGACRSQTVAEQWELGKTV